MNAEVDVLLVGIAGTGAVTIDGTRQILSPGHAIVIAKGANRGIQSMSNPFAYLTCHRAAAVSGRATKAHHKGCVGPSRNEECRRFACVHTSLTRSLMPRHDTGGRRLDDFCRPGEDWRSTSGPV